MNKTILIIEDERSLRDALTGKLAGEGFTILTANDGEEGLRVALEQHPDLILLDIVMPKMSGMELATHLRQDEWGKSAKVLLLTNLDDVERVQKAMENEIYTYLVKSNSPIQSVVEKVQEILG